MSGSNGWRQQRTLRSHEVGWCSDEKVRQSEGRGGDLDEGGACDSGTLMADLKGRKIYMTGIDQLAVWIMTRN